VTVDDFLRGFNPQGRALVVGSKCYNGKADRRALYTDAVGIDQFEGEGVDIVHDFESPLDAEHGTFDHIDCCSVLEHVKHPWIMCDNILRVMNPGATIVVSVPFIWRQHGYPSDYWRITRETLPILFPSIKWIKSGYLSGNELRKKPPALTIGGDVYMMKTEVVGFGVNTDNPCYRS
jgi:SAM-dependent methyltransferase